MFVTLNSVLLSLFSHRQQARGLFMSGNRGGATRVNQRKRKVFAFLTPLLQKWASPLSECWHFDLIPPETLQALPFFFFLFFSPSVTSQVQLSGNASHSMSKAVLRSLCCEEERTRTPLIKWLDLACRYWLHFLIFFLLREKRKENKLGRKNRVWECVSDFQRILTLVT